VTCTREKRKSYRVVVGKSEGKRPLEDAGVGGGIISNESGGNRIEMWGPDSSGLEQRPVASSPE
jgi:hypothetical protein